MELSGLAQVHVHLVAADARIDAAWRTMQELGIRHLPVVRPGGEPVGMLSERDVLSCVGGLSEADRIGAAAPNGPRFVYEIMSTPLRSFPPDAPIEAAGRLLIHEKIGAVAMVHDGKICGLCTSTDFLRCYGMPMNRPRGSWRFAHLRTCMTRKVICLRPEDTLALAWKLMRTHRIRHILVSTDGQLRGIVSNRDIRREIGQALTETGDADSTSTRSVCDLPLRAIMTSPVMTARPSLSLANAAGLMITNRIGALPVVNDGRLVGIACETDLLRVLITAFENEG